MTCLFTFVCSKVDRLFHYSHYRRKLNSVALPHAINISQMTMQSRAANQGSCVHLRWIHKRQTAGQLLNGIQLNHRTSLGGYLSRGGGEGVDSAYERGGDDGRLA